MKGYKNTQLGIISIWLLVLTMIVGLSSCKDELLERKTETRLVTFNSMGGSEVPPQTVFVSTTIRKPENPTRELYFFSGWYLDEDITRSFSYSTVIGSDMTLYAGWRPAVVVSFESNGGTLIENDTIPVGETVPTPVDPSRDNSVFLGWYLDADLTTEFNFPTTPINQDLTLYAKWMEGITLTFETNASVSLPGIGVLPGTVIAAPTDPVVPESTFMGWFADEALQIPYDFSQPLTENATAYAKWFQNIYTLRGEPVANPTYYVITGFKPEFTNTSELYIPNNIGGMPVRRIDASGETAHRFYGKTTITEVYLEEGITHLLHDAFRNCSNLTTVRFPSTLINIGNHVFNGCVSLSGALKIPDTLTSWGGSSFINCSSLEKVELPLNYALIPNGTFRGCSNLQELYIPRTALVTKESATGTDPIRFTHADLKIYVPANLVGQYQSDANWSEYASRIQAIP